MRHFRITFFFLAVALTLSGCGIFGGSDGSDVVVADDFEAQPTVNSVQAVPAATAVGSTTTDDGTQASEATTDSATAALPTAVTLPTTAPTPEPTVDRSQPTTYIVQSGDVLGLIAERFDADIAELRRVNDLDGNLIRVGQELTIPALDGSTTESASGDSAAPAATTAPAAAATTAPAATVSCNSTATGHCVQPGESLLGIALKYDVSVESLRAANPSIVGDLIKSGEVLNLSGGGTASPAATSVPAPSGPAATAAPVATVGPTNDAECEARNRDFPYFHAADGLCYANPIGATVVPTSAGASNDGDTTCDPGFFLWEDGLCYPIPGATVVATAGPTPTNPPASAIYGRPPCRDGYVEIVASNVCWPEPDTTPTTPTPVATAAATECVAPNFFQQGTNCFVTVPQGQDAGCTVEDGKPTCPAT